MRDFAPHLRYALRGLRRSPLFAVSAIATLALGIAAVVAVFSVVDAVLLRPLPFRQPERLVALWEVSAPGAGGAGRVDGATFADWRDGATSFEQLAAFGAFGGTLTGEGDPRLLRGALVTPSYFETLGVSPHFGRFFLAGEDDGSTRVAVLGHGLWRERFGASPDVIGRTLTVSGAAYTIVGVAPELLYPTWPVNGPRMHFHRESQDLWVPLPRERLTQRRSHLFGVVGRLADQATPESAQAELARVAAGRRVAGLGAAAVRPLVEEAVGDVRPALRLLFAAAALVLLAAVTNVGGLVLARALAHRHELAVRRALGADLPALVRRQLAEALIVTSTAAVAGAAFAAGALPLLLRWVPRDVPRLDSATIDLRALGVAVAVSLLASTVLALVSLVQARRTAPADALREGGRITIGSARSQRLGQLLVGAQVALAVALAITASLFVESLRRLEASPLGVSTERLLVVDLELPTRRYGEPSRVASFFREVVDRVAARPGIVAAHLAYDHPLETNWLDAFALEGREQREETSWTAELRFATPGYFDDLEIPLHAGREFEPTDGPDARPVALVNRAFARRFFGGDDPVGSTLRTAVASYTWGEGAPTSFEIVGVVGDVATPGIERSAEPCFYLDVWQVPMPELKLLVRSSGPPALALPIVRSVVAELDRDQAIGKVRTLEHERLRAVAQPRFSTRLTTLFGAAALALASLGVYGLLAGWVAGRQREIGVRAALGAGRVVLLALVLRRGFRLAMAGIAGGVVAALALGKLLSGQLYGISAAEPGAILVASGIVLAAAIVACVVPAARATRVDPARVLHEG